MALPLCLLVCLCSITRKNDTNLRNVIQVETRLAKMKGLGPYTRLLYVLVLSFWVCSTMGKCVAAQAITYLQSPPTARTII